MSGETVPGTGSVPAGETRSAGTHPGAVDVGGLFDEYGARVLAFVHRMLGDRAEAEDVTQETFLRAYRGAGTFAGDCAPSTWLFAIARNACLDRLAARRPRSFSSLEEIVTRQPPVHDTATEAQRHWYVQAVREGCLLGTLACLTADQRAAFVLRVLCDVSTEDTAAILGRSPNAVRVLTHRARRRLKAFLCRNCSGYDPANPCRCENLVGFCLARGWIGPDDRRIAASDAAAGAAHAAAVVDDVARLTAVYAAIPDPRLDSGPGRELAARIRSRLRVPDPVGRPGDEK